MLQTVTTPDSHVTTYGYDPTHTSWLNGITVDGTKLLAVTYQTNGQVASSGTPDGEAVENFSYVSNSTTVTNQLGDSTTFGYQTIQGGKKLASVSHLGTSTCPAMAATTAYDANGWVDYTLDWRGTKTDYTYTVDGRLADQTLAAGTTTPLKDVYTWTTTTYTGQYVLQSDAAYNTAGTLVRTTSYVYTPSGYVSSVSVKDQATGVIASVSYGYTFAANNTLQSRTETRNLPTGASTTTFNYDGSGNVSSVTDPSGATVSFSSYDGLGRPGAMVAANGVSHTFTYDGRGNLATDTAYLANGNAVTTYGYDGRSKLVSVSLPDGSAHHFTIAQSGRVAAQTDVAGNPATQTFTNASTIVASQGRAAATVSGSSVSSSITGSVSSTSQLDSLGRPYNVVGNNSQHVAYGYDANSNVTSVSDALHTTTNAYDALNRISQTILPDASTIAYAYAPNGTLGSVTTSRGAQTTYTTNGFGRVTQRSSPDTGLTTYTVDPFGRVTQEVRANGTTVAYGYDGLDRLTSRTSNGNTETYSFASAGINATRLTGISNPTGSSSFGYDGYGHVNSQTDVIFGQSFGTSYSYNAAGQLASMSYPDGLGVTYSYNGAGQVTGVTPSRSGGSVASAVYQPFGGGPYAWAYGNGASMVGAVDADGRLTSLNSVFAKTISYNTDNTIYGINDSAFPAVNETFSYNAQSRLMGTTRSADPQSFAIDSDGNRTSATRAGATTTYPIASGGNKVTSWTYMGGDIYSDGVRYYTRDEFDRLTAVTMSGQTVGQYRYDAMDRRVYKSTSQGVTYFTYTPSGQLLYEQSSQRAVNYVWLSGRLVGISVNHGALQSVHTDWLGRPELVTSTSSPTVVWRASNAVFDRKVTLDSIGGLNIFFPGQYYDTESDLYYNWHRYYDASSGRYVQSDPIGLAGGVNTYAYAAGSPAANIDPTGLDTAVIISGAIPTNPLGHIAIAFTAGGVYSEGTNTPTGGSVSGYWVTQAARRAMQVIIIPTTPKQEAAIKASMNQSMQGTYNTLNNNCASMVGRALGAGGIGSSSTNIPLTAGLTALSAPGATSSVYGMGSFMPDVLNSFNP
jgi:RHS repeat-associated protein